MMERTLIARSTKNFAGENEHSDILLQNLDGQTEAWLLENVFFSLMYSSNFTVLSPFRSL